MALIREYTREEKARILALMHGIDQENAHLYATVLKTHDHDTLVLAARLVRRRLLQIETEIATRP